MCCCICDYTGLQLGRVCSTERKCSAERLDRSHGTSATRGHSTADIMPDWTSRDYDCANDGVEM